MFAAHEKRTQLPSYDSVWTMTESDGDVVVDDEGDDDEVDDGAGDEEDVDDEGDVDVGEEVDEDDGESSSSGSVVLGDEASVVLDDEGAVVAESSSDGVVVDDDGPCKVDVGDGSPSIVVVVGPTGSTVEAGVEAEASSRGPSEMSPATIETAPKASAMAMAVASNQPAMNRKRPMGTSYDVTDAATPTGG